MVTRPAGNDVAARGVNRAPELGQTLAGHDPNANAGPTTIDAVASVSGHRALPVGAVERFKRNENRVCEVVDVPMTPRWAVCGDFKGQRLVKR